MGTPIRFKLLPYLIYSALTIIFFYKFIFYGKAFLPGDILYADYPFKAYKSIERVHNPYLSDVIDQYLTNNIILSKALKDGVPPLWNPYAIGGYPLLANPTTGAAYPIKLLLYLLFDPIYAHSFNLMIHLLLMGIFMYLFARSINLTEFGSITAGTVWMFNGCTMVWLEFEYAVIISAWMPLLFLFAEKYFHEEKVSYLLLCGLTIGLTMLGGMPQLAVYVITLFSFYFLIRRPSWKCTLLIIVPLSIGAMTAAVQLLPTFELLRVAQRPELSFEYITKYAGVFPLANIITFFIPDFFGSPVDGYYFAGGASVNDAQNYVELTGYCGLLPIILAITAAVMIRNRYSSIFSVAMAVSILAAMGTPVYYIFYLFVPGFSKLKAISRILIITAFSISILSGMGADFIFERAKNITRRLSIIVIAITFLYPVSLLILHSVLKDSNQDTYTAPNLAGHFTIINSSFFIPLILLIFISLLFYLVYKSKNVINLKIFAVVIILFDLIYFGWKFNTTVDRNIIYQHISEIDNLQRDKDIFRVMTVGIRPNLFMPYLIQSVGGYNNLYPKIFFEFINLIEKKEDKHIKHFVYFTKPYSTNLVNILNVKYTLLSKDISDRWKSIGLSATQAFDIHENTDFMPRAFLVHKSRFIEKDEDILKELGKDSFRPDREVLLQDPVFLNNKDNISRSAVEINQYSLNRITLTAETDHDGFLILSDTYYPGWKVYIDSQEKRIYKADYAFRGVLIKKGKHKIEFVYSPFSFSTGLTITLLTLSFIIFWLIAANYGFTSPTLPFLIKARSRLLRASG